MNAKTLLAIATAVAVLFAGLGAAGAVAADQSPDQPADEELPDTADDAADRDRDGDRANESERDRVREHANETDGEFGPHHADDRHGPHYADENTPAVDDRPGFAGPMWGVADTVPDDVPTNVTHMHEVMQSYFDNEEPPYRFGETIRSIAGGEHPWSDDHPRNDRGDDHRHGNGR
ncbi:hypothetical protein RH858_06045 [Halalkaliarchaeum sp. AArc-GB]|uniref:hypothetical protein n=1 Tax=Halalkaliarchaeum sp. AArc-GB TaxID=3074078 RepID=UPI00285E94D8|nr:hypothetical protein [Halalkaliarchaeum sp. AArc-GB]MDR5672709.1 hypothetical protein [Halalkaliarchaeum sp. AArc-GB]